MNQFSADELRLDTLPDLPDELLPYNRNNPLEVYRVLSWQIRECLEQGMFNGYEDIDQGFIAFSLQNNIPEEEILNACKVIFGDDYDEDRTRYMVQRTQEKLRNGESLIGAGSFVKKVKDLDLKIVERFIRELQVKRHHPTYVATKPLADRIAGINNRSDYRTVVHPLIKEIAQLQTESERDIYIRQLSGASGIKEASIRKDVKKLSASEPVQPLLGTSNIILAHPSYEIHQDFMALGFRETIVVDDKPKDRNVYIIATADGQYHLTDKTTFELGGQRIIFDERKRILAGLNDKWLAEMVSDFLNNPCAPEGMYEEVKTIIQGYVEFPKEASYGLIAAWIIATYFHQCFHAFPFLSFTAKKQSGKSRVLTLLERLAFNAFKIKGVSVPSLADSIDSRRATVLLDQAESLADSHNLQILGILADSYTKDGGKRRIIDTSNNTRSIVEFETYSPKAFASIIELDTDLRDRTIEVIMIRTMAEYPYPDAHLPLWRETRDKLYRLLLTKWQEVKAIYEAAGQGVGQRVRELWRPLDTILILEKVSKEEKQAVKAVFMESMQETQVGLTDWEEKLINAILNMMGGFQECVCTVSEIVDAMGIPTTERFPRKSQEQWVGKTIKRLDLYSSKEGKENNTRRQYRFKTEKIKNILARYQNSPGNLARPLIDKDLQKLAENRNLAIPGNLAIKNRHLGRDTSPTDDLFIHESENGEPEEDDGWEP